MVAIFQPAIRSSILICSCQPDKRSAELVMQFSRAKRVFHSVHDPAPGALPPVAVCDLATQIAQRHRGLIDQNLVNDLPQNPHIPKDRKKRSGSAFGPVIFVPTRALETLEAKCLRPINLFRRGFRRHAVGLRRFGRGQGPHLWQGLLALLQVSATCRAARSSSSSSSNLSCNRSTTTAGSRNQSVDQMRWIVQPKPSSTA